MFKRNEKNQEQDSPKRACSSWLSSFYTSAYMRIRFIIQLIFSLALSLSLILSLTFSIDNLFYFSHFLISLLVFIFSIFLFFSRLHFYIYEASSIHFLALFLTLSSINYSSVALFLSIIFYIYQFSFSLYPHRRSLTLFSSCFLSFFSTSPLYPPMEVELLEA